MEYNNIKNIDKKVSRLLMGTMILNLKEMEHGFKTLDSIYELGVNTFDCAAGYADGESEAVLGKWINERGIRESVTVLTKGAHHNRWRKRVTPYDILADVSDSLSKLMTKYIDIYLLHRDDPDVPVSIIVDTLNRLYDAGKIRCFGGSNWTYRRIEEANEYAYKFGLMPFNASSPNYSLARQVDNPWGPGCVTLSGPDEKDARDFYRRTNIPVFAYSSLGRGFFSGSIKSDDQEGAKLILDDAAQKGYMYKENFERLKRVEILAKEKDLKVPQIAVAWVMHQQMNLFAIIGAINKEQMKDNIEALALKLTDREIKWLDLAIEER